MSSDYRNSAMRFLTSKTLPLVALLGVLLSTVRADTFGTGEHQFTIDFVPIGNPGNAGDASSSGLGAVSRPYRMGAYEVSSSMIDAYNAVSGGPTLNLSEVQSGPNRPVVAITWNQAARFVNWLNTSKGYSAAYNFTTGGDNDNVSHWIVSDPGYDPSNPLRNANAFYFLPTEDEWYKAGYYDPAANGGAGGYWDFATGSDAPPTPVPGGTASGTAVYGFQPTMADVTNAGGLSPHGTMGQNGNVHEWLENEVSNDANGNPGERRVRGGNWVEDAGYLNLPFSLAPNYYGDVGFRVASIPEPSAWAFAVVAAAGWLRRRRR